MLQRNGLKASLIPGIYGLLYTKILCNILLLQVSILAHIS